MESDSGVGVTKYGTFSVKGDSGSLVVDGLSRLLHAGTSKG